MKRCTKCKKRLSLNSFRRNSKSKDGLQSACKECLRDQDIASGRLQGLYRIVRDGRCKICKEILSERCRNELVCRTCYLARHKQYYQKTRQARLAYMQKYSKTEKVKKRKNANARKWYWNRLELSRKYNREKHRALTRKSWAKSGYVPVSTRIGKFFGYAGAHFIIKKSRGLASNYLCSCGLPARDWALHHDAPIENLRVDNHSKNHSGCVFSVVVNDYSPKCQKCNIREGNPTLMGWSQQLLARGLVSHPEEWHLK